MIDNRLKYQAVLFLNAQDINANQSNIKNLMTQFSDKELLPGTFQEIGPFLPVPSPRIRLSSVSNEWEIIIGSTRIDIEKNPITLKGENLGDLKEFCTEASSAFGKILELFPRKSNRVALVTRFFLKEMSEDQLKKTYQKLFNSPKTYTDNNPFEWNWRSVVKIPKAFSDKKEDLNYITSLGRTTSELREQTAVILLDRIEINIDINTSNLIVDNRFEKEDVDAFFSSANIWHDELVNEIIEFIE